MRRVADQLNRCVIRDDYDCQGNVSEPRHSITGQAAGIMRQHIEQPLSPAEIAARIGINLRRLQRAFRQYEKTTPTQFYMRERLLRARSMLRQSPASISEIARACGFASISDFAHNYQRMFGCRPSSDR
jgi:transcriptional regulator GlxA family with amidase domain